MDRISDAGLRTCWAGVPELWTSFTAERFSPEVYFVARAMGTTTERVLSDWGRVGMHGVRPQVPLTAFFTVAVAVGLKAADELIRHLTFDQT